MDMCHALALVISTPDMDVFLTEVLCTQAAFARDRALQTAPDRLRYTPVDLARAIAVSSGEIR